MWVEREVAVQFSSTSVSPSVHQDRELGAHASPSNLDVTPTLTAGQRHHFNVTTGVRLMTH